MLETLIHDLSKEFKPMYKIIVILDVRVHVNLLIYVSPPYFFHFI